MSDGVLGGGLDVGVIDQAPVAVAQGVPSAVLMAPADLESLEETIAILSDREAMQRLDTSEAELTAGLGESEADLAAAMERRRRASTT